MKRELFIVSVRRKLVKEWHCNDLSARLIFLNEGSSRIFGEDCTLNNSARWNVSFHLLYLTLTWQLPSAQFLLFVVGCVLWSCALIPPHKQRVISRNTSIGEHIHTHTHTHTHTKINYFKNEVLNSSKDLFSSFFQFSSHSVVPYQTQMSYKNKTETHSP